MTPLSPSNKADPTVILEAFYRDLDPECVISLPLYSTARKHSAEHDHWQIFRQVLAQPAVYEAFGISSVPSQNAVHVTWELEVIGTLANLLDRGGIHSKFVESTEEAIEKARQFLDAFVMGKYINVTAYSCGAWCNWFCNDGILDETLIFNKENDWWLFAVTGSD